MYENNIRGEAVPVFIAGTIGSGGNPVTGGGTSDRQFTSVNDSIVTSDGTAGTIAAGGVAFIQNLAAAAVYVKLGAGASSSNFSFVLSASTAPNDGLGGSRDITNYSGVVSVAAATSTPRVIFSNFS